MSVVTWSRLSRRLEKQWMAEFSFSDFRNSWSTLGVGYDPPCWRGSQVVSEGLRIWSVAVGQDRLSKHDICSQYAFRGHTTLSFLRASIVMATDYHMGEGDRTFCSRKNSVEAFPQPDHFMFCTHGMRLSLSLLLTLGRSAR